MTREAPFRSLSSAEWPSLWVDKDRIVGQHGVRHRADESLADLMAGCRSGGVLVLSPAAERALRPPRGPHAMLPAKPGKRPVHVYRISAGTREDLPVAPIADDVDAGTDAKIVLWGLDRWRQLTGATWSGHPGLSGLDVLKVTAPGGSRAEGFQYAWKATSPDEGSAALWKEAPLRRVMLRPGQALPEQLIRVDANRRYLASAATVPVGRGRPKPGPTEFTPGMCGWWHVERPLASTGVPWDGDLAVPDGAYPLPREDGRKGVQGLIWASTPTVQYWTEQGHQMTIHGSWVVPASTVLRDWARTLDRVWTSFEAPARAGFPGPQAMAATAKAAYRQAIGLMGSTKSALYRPDWHEAITAHARLALYRPVMRLVRATGMTPVIWDVDAVYYDASDSRTNLISNFFTPGSRLGEWKIDHVSAHDRFPGVGRVSA